MHMNTFANISMRALVIAAVLAVVGAAALSRAAAPGITFALENDIVLTIGSRAFFNGLPVPSSTWALKDLAPTADKFFNLGGVMPGDSGTATITMHVAGRQSAWLCLDFVNFQKHRGLADGTQFFAWRDNGDGIFTPSEQPIFGTTTRAASSVLNGKTYAIADSTTGQALPIGSTRSVGVEWCAGHLVVGPAGLFSCLGSALGNEAQRDSFSVDVAMRAVSAREQPAFACSGGESGEGRPPRDVRPPRPERPPRPTR